MKKIILSIVIGLAFIGCAEKTQSVEDLRIELNNMEIKTPLEYLKQDRINLFTLGRVEYGDPSGVVEMIDNDSMLWGRIINNASLATFKDIIMELSFYTSTSSLIIKDTITIYDFFTPGDSTKIKLSVMVPSKYDNYELKIIDAIGVVEQKLDKSEENNN
jgi:hypothetical protein